MKDRLAPPLQQYPPDVADEEWAFVARYLTSMRPDAPLRTHDLRKIFNALRWLLRTGAHGRNLPHAFPPWAAVYRQAQRWLAAGVFATKVHACACYCARCRAAPTSGSKRFRGIASLIFLKA